VIRLIKLEMRRFWARRLFKNAVLVILTVMSVVGVVQWQTHSPEAPTVESIQAEKEARISECRGYSVSQWEQRADFASTDPDFGHHLDSFDSAEEYADDSCREEFFQGFVEENRLCYGNLWREELSFDAYSQLCPDLAAADFGLEQRMELSETTETIIQGVPYRLPSGPEAGALITISTALLLLAIVFGASFVGAEYRAGTIENLLLWEPRRGRVMGAKLVAVGVSSAVVHAGLLGSMMLLLIPAAKYSGSFAGVDAEFWTGVGNAVLRGSIAAALVAASAGAVGLILRNTAGVVGTFMGYGLFGSLLIRLLLPKLYHFEIGSNSSSFVAGGDVARTLQDIGVFHHGPWGAAFVTASSTLVLIAGAWLVFSRRDVD
jgi:ABC-type transport system involved in multi-copper enzyme maturation permease subunit